MLPQRIDAKPPVPIGHRFLDALFEKAGADALAVLPA
jgi:hypothetical protein